MADPRTDIAIVGGGPAGAAVAIHLARRGIEVTIFERTTEARWRACGVYSSPMTRRALAGLGIAPDQTAALVRNVPGLRLETAVNRPPASTRLAYERWGGACGIDRVALDGLLLGSAERAGAQVLRGAIVRGVGSVDRSNHRDTVELDVSSPGGPERWRARLVVGADGPGSLVARAFGVQRRSRLLRRAGITFHLPIETEPGTDARMVIGRGWYCGLCPVPGDRLNVGIVIGETELRAALHATDRPGTIARRVLSQIPGDGARLSELPVVDHVAVSLPLANRVRRLSGPGFVLIGDAAGFLDPITGEGLHRALRSAACAGDAIAKSLDDPRSTSLADYDRHLRRRSGRKDAVSWMLQAFLSRPEALAYAVRRLEGRPHLRETFSSVMADIRAPEQVLDPRFLVGLLRP